MSRPASNGGRDGGLEAGVPSRAPRPPARGPRASRLAGDGRSPSRPRDPSPGLETEARAAEDDAPLPPASRRSSASMRLRFAEALPSGSGAPPPIADVSPSAADQAATTVTRPKALRPPKRALAGVRAAVAASISSLFRRARERSARLPSTHVSLSSRIPCVTCCPQLRTSRGVALRHSGQRAVGLRERPKARAALQVPWRMPTGRRMRRRTSIWAPPWYVPDVSNASSHLRIFRSNAQ